MLLIALGVVLGTGAAGAGTVPTARVASAAPLTVVGASFAPQERLRVVVRFDGERRVRFVRTSLAGRFTARFLEATVEDRVQPRRLRDARERADGRGEGCAGALPAGPQALAGRLLEPPLLLARERQRLGELEPPVEPVREDERGDVRVAPRDPVEADAGPRET